MTRNISQRAIDTWNQWGGTCERAAIFLQKEGCFGIRESWQIGAWVEKQATGSWPRVEGASTTAKEGWTVPHIDEGKLKTWAPSPSPWVCSCEWFERWE